MTAHRTADTITAHVRFPAGEHITLTLPVPPPAAEQRKTPTETVHAVDELLDEHTSGQIAAILGARGLASGTGQRFHRLMIDNIVRTYQLRSRYQRLRENDMLTLAEIAEDRLSVNPATVKQWTRAGIVSGLRYNDKHEMLYYPPDPDSPPVPHQGRRLARRRPAQTQQGTEST